MNRSRRRVSSAAAVVAVVAAFPFIPLAGSTAASGAGPVRATANHSLVTLEALNLPSVPAELAEIRVADASVSFDSSVASNVPVARANAKLLAADALNEVVDLDAVAEANITALAGERNKRDQEAVDAPIVLLPAGPLARVQAFDLKAEADAPEKNNPGTRAKANTNATDIEVLFAPNNALPLIEVSGGQGNGNEKGAVAGEATISMSGAPDAPKTVTAQTVSDLATVTLFGGTGQDLHIQIVDQPVMTVSANGMTGGATATYTAPLIQVFDDTNTLLGEIRADDNPSGENEIDTPVAIIRAGNLMANLAPDGTTASASAAVLEIQLLPGAPGVGDHPVRFAVGDVTASLSVPAGGVVDDLNVPAPDSKPKLKKAKSKSKLLDVDVIDVPTTAQLADVDVAVTDSNLDNTATSDGDTDPVVDVADAFASIIQSEALGDAVDPNRPVEDGDPTATVRVQAPLGVEEFDREGPGADADASPVATASGVESYVDVNVPDAPLPHVDDPMVEGLSRALTVDVIPNTAGGAAVRVSGDAGGLVSSESDITAFDDTDENGDPRPGEGLRSTAKTTAAEITLLAGSTNELEIAVIGTPQLVAQVTGEDGEADVTFTAPLIEIRRPTGEVLGVFDLSEEIADEQANPDKDPLIEIPGVLEIYAGELTDVITADNVNCDRAVDATTGAPLPGTCQWAAAKGSLLEGVVLPTSGGEIANVTIAPLEVDAIVPMAVDIFEDARVEPSTEDTFAGKKFDYTATIPNAGNNPVDDLIVTLDITGPDGFTLSGEYPDATDPRVGSVNYITIAPDHKQVVWSFATGQQLPPTDIFTGRITVETPANATAGQVFEGFATISGEVGGIPLNVTVPTVSFPEVIELLRFCDLRGSEESQSHDEVENGNEFDYFIHLLNAGDQDCDNIVVRHTFEPGSDFVACSDGCAYIDTDADTIPDTVEWTVPALGPGESLTLTQTNRVDPGTAVGTELPGTSVITTTSDSYDPTDPANPSTGSTVNQSTCEPEPTPPATCDEGPVVSNQTTLAPPNPAVAPTQQQVATPTPTIGPSPTPTVRPTLPPPLPTPRVLVRLPRTGGQIMELLAIALAMIAAGWAGIKAASGAQRRS